MTKKEYETFLFLLDKLVNGEGSWIARRQKLEDEASEDDKTNLREFAAWFS